MARTEIRQTVITANWFHVGSCAIATEITRRRQVDAKRFYFGRCAATIITVIFKSELQLLPSSCCSLTCWNTESSCRPFWRCRTPKKTTIRNRRDILCSRSKQIALLPSVSIRDVWEGNRPWKYQCTLRVSRWNLKETKRKFLFLNFISTWKQLFINLFIYFF